MKRKYKIVIKLALVVFLLAFTFNKTQAQQVLITSGNNASGDGGTASYSVGQIIQENSSGTNGSAIQGIQFYFEDSTLSIIDLETNLEILTYPNPTVSTLNISISDFKPNMLNYKLFNSLGQLINSGLVTDKITKIDVNSLPTATYILKISNNTNRTTQTYKIIKN